MALNTPIDTSTSGYSRSYRRRIKRSPPVAPPSSSQLLMEQGTDALLLENGSDILMLEA
jgi:hypothetical protein